MAITTFSRFIFGHVVTSSIQGLSFSEDGSTEINATVPLGAYSFRDFAQAVCAAMNEVGSQTYSYTIVRSAGQRHIQISAASPFQFLFGTGTYSGSGALGTVLMGFTAADTAMSATQLATNASGSEYCTQFLLQDYVDPEDYQEPVDAVVSETAGGRIEVISFGLRKYLECSIKYATNRTLPDDFNFVNNASGVTALRTFLQYAVLKYPVELETTRYSGSELYDLTLDTTESHQDGTGYKLKEMISSNLPGFYETGVLRWRVNE